MTPRERGYLMAFIGLCVLAALLLRLPQIVERMAYQDFVCANRISVKAHERLVHVQRGRACASISAVNTGEKIAAWWR